MATQVKFRGGTTIEHSTFVGSEREMTVDTTKDTLVVHDGSTAGGFPLVREAGSTMTGDLNFGDAVKAQFGTGNDLQIYHDGSDSRIDDAGAGGLYLRGNSGVYLRKYTGETLATFNADGPVDLYYNNATRISTTSIGASVSGTCSATAFSGDGSNLSGLTVSNIGDITATAAELNYTTNVTSDIQSQLDSKTTSTYVDTEIANLIDSAPGTLDTLNELAAAMGDDPNHVTTMTDLINGLIPTGSVMMFYQAAAPTGWTQSTVHNDKALRVVNTAGGGSGGSTAFSSAWSNISHSHGYGTLAAAAHTLTTAEMPAHVHGRTVHFGGSGAMGVQATNIDVNNQHLSTIPTQTEGGGGSHSHTISGSAASTTMTHAPHYVDVIICSRN